MVDDAAAEVVVAPTGAEVVVTETAVVDVVAREVEVDRTVDVVVCSTGLAVVEVVGDTETETGIWAAGVVRTVR